MKSIGLLVTDSCVTPTDNTNGTQIPDNKIINNLHEYNPRGLWGDPRVQDYKKTKKAVSDFGHSTLEEPLNIFQLNACNSSGNYRDLAQRGMSKNVDWTMYEQLLDEMFAGVPQNRAFEFNKKTMNAASPFCRAEFLNAQHPDAAETTPMFTTALPALNSSHIAVVGCQQNMVAGSLMNELSKSTCAPNVRHNSCPLHYAVTYNDAMAFVPGFHTQHGLAERMKTASVFDRVASPADVIRCSVQKYTPMTNGCRDQTCVDWVRSPLRLGGSMESYYTVADGQTTVGGFLPLGGKTDLSGLGVCADQVGVFAMQGNHMGPKKKKKKQKSDWGQGNMMSDSHDERELSAIMFVQNCVSAASS